MVLEDGLVELADAIGVVREQLIAAQQAGHGTVGGHVLSFAVGKVSIEFSGEVRRTTGAGGGVKFYVVTADAKSEQVRGVAHKVSVELLPQNPDGSSFRVRDGVDTPPGH